MINAFSKKLLGEILIEANLISSAQRDLALKEQEQYHDWLLGEILALHGWIKQETADFFAQKWLQLVEEERKKPLGYYLENSALLTSEQINHILAEQKILGIKFGSVAVIKGWIKQETIEFFLKYLAPERLKDTAFITPEKSKLEKDEGLSLTIDENSQEQFIIDPEDITWVG